MRILKHFEEIIGLENIKNMNLSGHINDRGITELPPYKAHWKFKLEYLKFDEDRL